MEQFAPSPDALKPDSVDFLSVLSKALEIATDGTLGKLTVQGLRQRVMTIHDRGQVSGLLGRHVLAVALHPALGSAGVRPPMTWQACTFSKQCGNHYAALPLCFAYDNFVRIHSSVRVTSAMATGLSVKRCFKPTDRRLLPYWYPSRCLGPPEASDTRKKAGAGVFHIGSGQ